MSNKPVITLSSGRHVDPLNVQPHEIHVEDIAHSLAQVNRFGGHVRMPISVAQHCVFVSYYVLNAHEIRDYPLVALAAESPTGMTEDQVCRQALLHDASEAYLGDVTKWLKQDPSFAAYRAVEDELQRRIFARYDVDTVQHPIVSLADKRICAFEAKQGGMTFASAAWPGYEPPTNDELFLMQRVGWCFINWHVAKNLFLDRFKELGGYNCKF